MLTSIIGFPRVGNLRELKFATEKYFKHQISQERLQTVAKEIREKQWRLLKENGNCQDALEYGNAASAMKNTVSGDMLWTDPQEMQQTIEMHHNIGQDFEMKR